MRDGIRLSPFDPKQLPAAPAEPHTIALMDLVSASVDLGVFEGTRVHDDALKVLSLPCGERWREAVTTPLLSLGNDLFSTGYLSSSALGAVKADTITQHRALTPLWRRRTRHGRVLSLDADLGGLSLHDLVAADIDLLTHTDGGVFEDERLNTALRVLTPAERAVVFAYAIGAGTTWTEAAGAAGAADPEAFGERVRRKAKRLAAEQERRLAHRRIGTRRARP
ncbi:hypothetical protein [Streptomyces sp. NPDC087856]|uniref:hypothetical protein n=1 Tax=Streptomyces sp. NPDC087856 TaxID=3365811 RepID=UPI00382D0937